MKKLLVLARKFVICWGSVCSVVVFLLLSTQQAFAKPPVDVLLKNYITHVVRKHKAKIQLGVDVGFVSSGKRLYSFRANEPMTPASVIKLVTSTAALKLLGPEYRFSTEIFVDRLPVRTRLSDKSGHGSGGVGNLYIRGYGDPKMVSERLWTLVQQLKRQGVRTARNVVIDDSLFIDPRGPLGQKAYQAGLSAVSLNHNCYEVSFSPAAVGQAAFVEITDGLSFELLRQVKTVRGSGNKIILGQQPKSVTYASALNFHELKTPQPFSPVSVKVIAKGKIGLQASPLAYYRTVPNPARYFGEVLIKSLMKEGIVVQGKLLHGTVPKEAKLLQVAQSETLAEIVRDLNHYSNNFIAEQLVFALGRDSAGYFRKGLGLARIAHFMAELGIRPDSFAMYDGSGLDKRDRISTEQIVDVLVYAYNDLSIAPNFLASLSRFGVSGTLKKRRFNKKNKPKSELLDAQIDKNPVMESVWGKTGTLDNVSSLAGILAGTDGRRFAYAIIINGRVSKSFATKIEDKIVGILIGLEK